MKNEIMRYESQIKISPASIGKINEQFALVDILLCYAEKNRNKTSIKKNTIESNLYSLYGCPIVGERIIKDDGSEDFGTHGGKIIIDDTGIKFEQTTKALGFITEDAVKNAKWVTVTEKDGHTKHDYLQLKGCVIWQERFEETKDLLEKDYPQSMEITIKESHYDDKNYLVIDDFIFTAACILGSDVEPCFESASIGRHYELDDIKSELDIMKSAYDTYRNKINENCKKEERTMDFSKITEKLSAFTYENTLGEANAKYSVIDVSEHSICILDKEDFKIYSADYAIVDNDVVIDIDHKYECGLTSKETDEGYKFNLSDEVNAVVAAAIESTKQSVSTAVAQSYSEEYDKKIKELTDAYAQLKSDYDTMSVEYNKYVEADKARIEKEHHNEIDTIVDKYAKKIGRLPKFLCYRAKIDYSKDVSEIENELILMAGEAMMNTSKQNFSYNPTECLIPEAKSEKYSHSNRYGNLFDKFINE